MAAPSSLAGGKTKLRNLELQNTLIKATHIALQQAILFGWNGPSAYKFNLFL